MLHKIGWSQIPKGLLNHVIQTVGERALGRFNNRRSEGTADQPSVRR